MINKGMMRSRRKFGSPRPSKYAWKKLSELVLARDGGCCWWCGVMTQPARTGRSQDLPPDTRTIDHIVDLADGGANHPDNLVVACRRCNAARNDVSNRRRRDESAAMSLAPPASAASNSAHEEAMDLIVDLNARLAKGETA